MPSIFSRIVSGEIPCYKIAETEQFLAFLDVRPQVKGHTLCIPKQEIDYIFDIEDPVLADLMVFAKKVGLALEQVIPCQRIGVAIIGLEVPHAHVHLIPINVLKDMSFNQSITVAPEEMQSIASAVAALVSF
jgi:histidine triad (HIT) family protein